MTATNIFFNFVGFRYSPALRGTYSVHAHIALRGAYSVHAHIAFKGCIECTRTYGLKGCIQCTRTYCLKVHTVYTHILP